MGHLVWWRLVGFKIVIERQVGKPKWALDCTGEYAYLCIRKEFMFLVFLGWIGCVLGHDLT